MSQHQQLFRRPSVVCETSRLRGRHFDCGVNAAKVEVRGLDNHRPAVIRQLLRVAQSLSREAAIEKAHAQVLAFRVVYGGQLHVWLADAGLARDRLADDRVVAPPVASRMQRPVGLDFGGVVHLLAKGCANAFRWRRVAFKAVAGDLEAASDRTLESAQEFAGRGVVTLADMDVQDEFCCAGDSQESVLVSAQQVVLAGILLQATHKAENLVDLNVANLDAFDLFGHKLLAVMSSGFKHVQHGVLAKAGESAYGADADAFTQHLNHLCGLGGLDPHAVHRFPVGECLSAAHAAEPLDDAVHVLKTSKPLRFAVTTNTVHSCLSRAARVKEAANRKIQQLLALPPLVAAWWVLLTLAKPLFHLRDNFTKGGWTLAVQVKSLWKIYCLDYQGLMQKA